MKIIGVGLNFRQTFVRQNAVFPSLFEQEEVGPWNSTFNEYQAVELF